MAQKEQPTKQYVDKTIVEQDRLYSDLFHAFVAYTRRTGKQRDNADEIANILGACAQSEKYDKTTKAALAGTATVLADIEELRDSHVRNLEEHVLRKLAKFANDQKGSQTDLRRSLSQVPRSKTPRSAASQSTDPQQQQNPLSQEFSRQLLDFETRRLSGLRSVLLNYVFSELAWHLKATELCSTAYRALQTIDEAEDVEEFRRSLQLRKEVEKLDRHRSHTSAQQ